MEKKRHSNCLAMAVVAITIAAIAGAIDPTSVSAMTSHYSGALPASVDCNFTATLKFSPKLTSSGGGTNVTTVKGGLSNCDITSSVVDGNVTITGAKVSGSFTSSPLACASGSATGTSADLTVTWRGAVDGSVGSSAYSGAAHFASSTFSVSGEQLITSTSGDLGLSLPGTGDTFGVTGSMGGTGTATLYSSDTDAQFMSACASRSGVKNLHMDGHVWIVRTIDLQNVLQLLSDGASYCAVLSSGTVDCWGANSEGNLGDGSTTNSWLPVPASGISSAVSIGTAGEGYCAVLSSGAVDCWGYNGRGELGDGSTTSSDTPVPVSGLTDAVSVVGVRPNHTAVGSYDYCALLSSGEVDCWGQNTQGQLGDGTSSGPDACSTPCSTRPVTVSGITTAVSLATDGGDSFCAVLASGAATCWGANEDGELGIGTNVGPNTCNMTACSTTPVTVEGVGGSGTLSGVSSLDSALDGYCGLLSSGELDCWGANDDGDLGNGTTTSTYYPVTVSGVGGSGSLSGVTNVTASGHYNYCALLSSGGVDCWGEGANGFLGDGSTTSSNIPVAVSGLSTATSIATDADSYCAIVSGGAVQCWGENNVDELGNGSSASFSDAPVTVLGVSGATSLAGSGNAYCAVITSGVACWGAPIP